MSKQGPSQKLTYTKEQLILLSQSPHAQQCPEVLLPQNQALIYGNNFGQGIQQENEEDNDELEIEPTAQRAVKCKPLPR